MSFIIRDRYMEIGIPQGGGWANGASAAPAMERKEKGIVKCNACELRLVLARMTFRRIWTRAKVACQDRSKNA